MAKLRIASAEAGDRAAWDAYLARGHGCTLFHDWRWGDVVEAVYGWRPIRLTARRSGEICGVLPLTDVRSVFFGRALISMGFTVGGGVLADDDEATDALAAAALEVRARCGARYLELRGGRRPQDSAWREKSGAHVKYEKALPKRKEDILPGVPRRRRAEIRKALAFADEGRLKFRRDSDARSFHRLYARLVHELGTPTPPLRFMMRLKEAFGRSVEIASVENEGEAIASALTFWRDGSVAPYYIGASSAARELRAYDYLYYNMMCVAVERGAGNFDFGRSKVGSPHARTKEYWGFEASPVVHYVATREGAQTPNISLTNPRLAALSNAWSNLPAPVARMAGPHLARHLA